MGPVRRWALPLTIAVLAALTAGPVSADGHAPVGVVIEGKGWGHGVGMAQDGAHAMGAAGASAGAILAHFYPGTTLGRRAGGPVRVDVYEGPGAVLVALPGGGEVRDAPSGAQSGGFPLTVPAGGTVRVSFDGGVYRAALPSAPTRPPPPPARSQPPPPAPPPPPPTTVAPGLLGGLLGGAPPPAPPPPAPPAAAAPAAPMAPPTPPSPGQASSGRRLWVVPHGGSTVSLPDQSRNYRGTLEVGTAGGNVTLTNHLDLEQYLQGMGEVLDPSWPAASLQAQAIAARTYALGVLARGANLCSTQQCQVYLGQTAEYGAMNRAVAATRGQVVTYRGELAETVYSASGGGVSATSEEGFGRGSTVHPYLQAVPYPTRDPQAWAVRRDLRQLAGLFGYRGRATAMWVSQTGPSGRPMDVTIDGDAGPLVVAGRTLFDVLDLRSTLYTIRLEEPSAPHTPSPAGSASGTFGLPGAQPARDAVGAAPPPAVGRERASWVALALLLIVACSLAGRQVAATGSRAAQPAGSARVAGSTADSSRAAAAAVTADRSPPRP